MTGNVGLKTALFALLGGIGGWLLDYVNSGKAWPTTGSDRAHFAISAILGGAVTAGALHVTPPASAPPAAK